MTHGLARVEELFEARTPKSPAIISDLDGNVKIIKEEKVNTVQIIAHDLQENTYYFDSNSYDVAVKE